MSSDVLTLPVGWLFIAGPPATPEDPTLDVARASQGPCYHQRDPVAASLQTKPAAFEWAQREARWRSRWTRDRYKKQSPLESTHSRSPSPPAQWSSPRLPEKSWTN